MEFKEALIKTKMHISPKLRDEYINDLRQKGYKVYVHMADINPNVAAGRNLRRFAETGRFVDLEATSFKYGNKP